jgi:hypothetical protein
MHRKECIKSKSQSLFENIKERNLAGFTVRNKENQADKLAGLGFQR